MNDDTRELLQLSKTERARVAGSTVASLAVAFGIIVLLLTSFVLGNIEAPLFRPSSPAYAQVPVKHVIIKRIIIIKRIVKVVVVRGREHFRHHRQSGAREGRRAS